MYHFCPANTDLFTLLEALEQISLFAVVLGFSFGNAPALYVTALIANICQAGFIFVRFVGSAFHHENQLMSEEAR